MSDLVREDCVACRPGAPRLTAVEIDALKVEVPRWSVVEREAIARLERVFPFADFVASLAFANRVGALAEAAGHHPAITTEWGRATVAWWTHAIGGLHRNDFIMAARTDALLDGR